jgi:hypothetical protein
MKEVFQDYEITLDFIPGDNKPEKLFIAFANAIKYFKKVDNMLAKTIAYDYDISSSLIEVRSGSLRGFFRTKVEVKRTELHAQDTSDDLETRIKNYLHNGRKTITQGLFDFEKANDEHINLIIEKVKKVAVDTGISEEPFFAPPSKKAMTPIIAAAQDTGETLDDKTSLFYSVENETLTELPKKIKMDKTLFGEEEQKTVLNTQQLILKIKKPDYLGDSKWEMKHGNNKLICKIEDNVWIEKFKSKKVFAFPGDSLFCNVRILNEYDSKLNLIKSEYFIVEVLDVIQGNFDAI